MKKEPKTAAETLSGVWGIQSATVEKANDRRSLQVGAVTRDGLAEQPKIADVFLAEGLFPKKVDAADVAIWQPAGQ